MEAGPTVRVLLADDDADVLSALADLLTADSRVTVVGTASDGATAERLAAQARPDAAVLDVRMPDGGSELVRRLAAQGIAVVCFSADGPSRSAMLDAGARDFVAKGDRIPDLVELILAAAAVRD